MVQTIRIRLGPNDYEIFVVGNETTIGQLNIFLDQFDDTEGSSGGATLSLPDLTSWFITRRIYAGMVFRDTSPFLARIKNLPALLRFNSRMKRQRLYINGDDYLEAAFLEKPQQIAQLLRVTEDEIRAGLKNTRFFEL